MTGLDFVEAFVLGGARRPRSRIHIYKYVKVHIRIDDIGKFVGICEVNGFRDFEEKSNVTAKNRASREVTRP